MALSDWKFPTPVPFIELYNTEILKGGYSYNFRQDNNSYTRWYTKDIKTFDLSDYLITPSAGNDFETDWFVIARLPNDYRIVMKVVSQESPAYKFVYWQMHDDNGNVISNSTPISGFGSHGGSWATSGGILLNNILVKIGLFTFYGSDPVGGTEPTGVSLRAFLGGKDGLYLPSDTVVDQCTTYIPYDKLHAVWQDNLFSITDIDLANTFVATHGKPLPPGTHFIGEEELPNDYDPSKPGGGDGNYSDNSDPIDWPENPTGGAITCGAIHAFKVDTTHINTLMSTLWDNNAFDPSTWQKLVASPLDCIVSLHAIPAAPATEAGNHQIFLGNFPTGVSAPIITSQYLTIDMGAVTLQKFFGSAMDYSPYTHVQIYLPGAGIYDLATEDVQGATIAVKYNMDVLTGDVSIQVKCGQSVLYKFTGNMKMQIPVSARDNTALGSAITGVAGVIGGAIKGGMTGGAGGAVVGGLLGGGLSTAAAVATRKESISRSGDMSGSISLMDDFRPYLIIHRPQQSLAVNYNKFKGYPSNLTRVLSSCSGYTEVQHIHLTGISGATDTELKEIEQMLKAGVII